jgi:hypothetical protein
MYQQIEQSQGLVIDQKPARKTFHLNEILSLSTGFLLAREGAAAVHRLVAFVMEEEASPESTARNNDAVRACLQEQLPFLKDVPLEGLHAIFKFDMSDENPYLQVWREMQQLRYGAEHYIVPLSRWNKQKNSHKLGVVRS